MERPDGEGTLENLIKLSAEGARCVSAESLRQKDGVDKRVCVFRFFFSVAAFRRLFYC